MLTKNNNSSGFTLVELAIVLIVIGLLVGMAFKGKELIESARVKAETAKISKIQTAFQIYKTKHDRLPGQGSDGNPTSNQAILQDLMGEGLLTENDLKSNMTQSKGSYWAFNGCGDQGTGDDSSWRILPTFNLDKICMYLTSENPKNIGAGVDINMKTDAQTICLLETLFDNRNILTGDGKKTVNSLTMWKQGAAFDNSLLLPCSDLKAYSGAGLWYAFRVY